MCTSKEAASSAGMLRWRTYNSSNSPPVETTSSYSLLLLLDCCCALLFNAWSPNRLSYLRSSKVSCNQDCWRSPAALIAVECWLTLVGTAST